MKKYLSVVLCILLIFANASISFADSALPVTVLIDDWQVNYTDSTGRPFIDASNRTQVPLRKTMEFYGCSVDWDPAVQRITVSKGHRSVMLHIGSDIMYVGNSIKWLDTTPVIISGRTYLPIRPVLEAFGSSVEYQPYGRTIIALSPEYKLANHSEGVKSVKYEWKDPYNSYWPLTWTTSLTLDRSLYNYYSSVDRNSLEGYTVYAKDSLDDGAMSDLIQSFRNGAKNYNNSQLASLVISFVQSFEYVTDDSWTGSYDEYPKFPYETLYDHCGDCEDTAILLVTLLLELGFDACMLKLPGHMAVGIKGNEDLPGWRYTHNGKQYFYIETTATGWQVGQIPDEYKNVNAELLFID